MFRASRDNSEEIPKQCIYPLSEAADNRAVKVDELLKGKASDAVLEEVHWPTLNDGITNGCLRFIMNISRRLKEEEDDENEETERKKLKRKVFEKLEEEGYEDIIPSFHELIDFLNGDFHPFLSLDISDYFVYVL